MLGDSSGPTPWSQILDSFKLMPTEILRSIFQLALPPHFLLNTSRNSAPDDCWHETMKTKKAVAEVCKEWHQIGVEFLYEHLVFHREKQVVDLAFTLTDQKEKYGRFVKSICVDNDLRTDDENTFLFEIIFRFSPSIQTLSLGPSCSHIISQPFWISTRPPTITELHLDLGWAFKDLDITPQLKCFSQFLKSLTLFTSRFHYTEDIQFCSLETLHLMVGNGAPEISVSAEHWKMPCLQRLTFSIMNQWGSLNTTCCEQLCKSVARSVKYLEIRPSGSSHYATQIQVQPILEALPAIERLVLHPNTVLPISHPKVAWVDLWLGTSDSPLYVTAKNITEDSFPSLRGVRVVDPLLSTLADIPAILPPRPEHFEYKYPGIQLRGTPDRLIRVDLFTMNTYDLSQDTSSSSDSDFEPSSSEDSDSDAESSLEGGDGFSPANASGALGE